MVISNLTFVSCIQQHRFNLQYKLSLQTLLFANCTNISLLGVTLLGSVDDAFFIGDTTGNITIDNVLVANSNPAGQALNICGSAIAFNHCLKNTTSYLSVTNSRFINKTNFVSKMHLLAAGGLTIVVRCPNVMVKIINLTMSNNTGYYGGNLAVIASPKYVYGSIEIANSIFEGGRAVKGAGMLISLGAIEFKTGKCKDNLRRHKLLHIYNSSFKNNVANYYGAGVCIEEKESLFKCNMINLVKFEKVNFTKNALIGTVSTGGGIALHSMILIVTDYIYHGNPQFKVILNNCHIHENYVKSLGNYSSATGVVLIL